MKIVPLKAPDRMDGETRTFVANELRELTQLVESGGVSGVFLVWGLGSEGTQALRAGAQDLQLLGRIEWMKASMIDGIE